MYTTSSQLLINQDLFTADGDFIFEQISVPGYELVLHIKHPKSRLNAIIAIHSTALGPTLGGTRISSYSSFDEALEDVLRLSKGMTYKSAVAEVGFGGGKSVIILEPGQKKTPELLVAFGQAVDKLKGLYICAEDMGCTMDDVQIIRQATQYVTGLDSETSSGDPGRFTAWGTFRGIEAVAQKLYGSPSLEGVHVSVMGLGNVGHYLVDYLFWAGAKLSFADINQEKAFAYAKKYGGKVLTCEEILSYECDIFAPCAVGGIINEKTIPLFRCKAIAGCANNQLAKNEHGELLRMRDILYAPDYVINAGGLHNVAAELNPGGYDPKAPRDKVHHIYDILFGIFEIAEKNNMSTQAAANALAEYRIRYKLGKRAKAPVFHH